jgi:hypothetical protein
MRYFLAREGEPEREVTKQEWVRAERAAGFTNTRGQPCEPATASWSVPGSRGRIEPLASA